MGAKKGSKKRFWSDEEKGSICAQTRAPGVSVAAAQLRIEQVTADLDAATPD